MMSVIMGDSAIAKIVTTQKIISATKKQNLITTQTQLQGMTREKGSGEVR